MERGRSRYLADRRRGGEGGPDRRAILEGHARLGAIERHADGVSVERNLDAAGGGERARQLVGAAEAGQ